MGASMGYASAPRTACLLSAHAESPTLRIVEFRDISVNQSLGNFSRLRLAQRNISLSLFQAGTVLAEKAAILLGEADAYNLSLNGDTLEFANNTNMRWIIENAPSVCGVRVWGRARARAVCETQLFRNPRNWLR